MRIICLNEIQDFSGFHSSAKYLFGLLPYRDNQEKLRAIITNTPSYQAMDEETAGAISYMIGINTFTENRDKYKSEGGYNMCKALRDWAADERAEGRAEGRANSLFVTAKFLNIYKLIRQPLTKALLPLRMQSRRCNRYPYRTGHLKDVSPKPLVVLQYGQGSEFPMGKGFTP